MPYQAETASTSMVLKILFNHIHHLILHNNNINLQVLYLYHVQVDFDLIFASLFHDRNMWCAKSGVVHEYKNDIRTILSRKIPDYQQRSELEIEVLFKWILEVHDHDPTGIG